MESRFDSHGSGERNIEVASKVEAMKGESCEKLHQQTFFLMFTPLLMGLIYLIPYIGMYAEYIELSLPC